MSSFSIIVAVDKKNGIGIQNKLPWHLPEDLAHFKKTTTGNTVIMGRKTYESIGRPLPNRRNIVLSKNPSWQAEGVETVTSLEQVNDVRNENDEIFIIGGAQIYELTLKDVSKIIITEIDANFECDAFFPEISMSEWQEVSREKHFSEKNQFHFSFVTYQRN